MLRKCNVKIHRSYFQRLCICACKRGPFLGLRWLLWRSSRIIQLLHIIKLIWGNIFLFSFFLLLWAFKTFQFCSAFFCQPQNFPGTNDPILYLPFRLCQRGGECIFNHHINCNFNHFWAQRVAGVFVCFFRVYRSWLKFSGWRRDFGVRKRDIRGYFCMLEAL